MKRSKKDKSIRSGMRGNYGQVIGRVPKLVEVKDVLNARQSISKIFDMDLPITIQVLNLSAGGAAQVISVNSSLVNNFSTRFASTFQEYRIIGGAFRFRVTATASPQGIVKAFIDEKDSSAPTLNQALDHPGIEIPIGSVTDDRPKVIKWQARDLLDLQFTQISVGSTIPLYIKTYTSGTLGTSGTTAGNIYISGVLAVQFRGLL